MSHARPSKPITTAEMIEFGCRLNAAIVAKYGSRYRAANALWISQSLVYRWSTGQYYPSTSYLPKLREAFPGLFPAEYVPPSEEDLRSAATERGRSLFKAFVLVSLVNGDYRPQLYSSPLAEGEVAVEHHQQNRGGSWLVADLLAAAIETRKDSPE